MRREVTPNPSFEARPNGRPPGPGRRYAYIFTGPRLASCRWSRLNSNVRRHKPLQSSGMRIIPFLVAAVAFLFGCESKSPSVHPDEFYAPTIHSDELRLTLVVSVEIAERNSKRAFVKLFELYGFSGNGPSIEQVVRHNAPSLIATFDSEGDAFVLKASSKPHFEAALQKLKCLEDVNCLNTWLKNASSILMKE